MQDFTISGCLGHSNVTLIGVVSLILLGTGLSGCATLQKGLDQQTQAVTGAAPLNTKIYPTNKAQLLASIADSYQKCGVYKRTLLFGSRASNFGFDVLTTTFSALATAFKPVATIHSLTAAATITSGSKTALDADVYMNATAPLMAEALSQSYDDKMQALHDEIASEGDGRLTHDFSEIERIHESCSLSQALVALQTLQSKASAATTPAPVTEAAVVPGAKFALSNGSQAVVTAKTGAAPATEATFTLQDPAGSTPMVYGPMPVAQALSLLNAAGAKPKPAS